MFGKTANVTGVNNEVHVGKAGRKSVLTLKPKVGIAEEGTHTHTHREASLLHQARESQMVRQASDIKTSYSVLASNPKMCYGRLTV